MSDETLMAYADGELDPPQRAAGRAGHARPIPRWPPRSSAIAPCAPTCSPPSPACSTNRCRRACSRRRRRAARLRRCASTCWRSRRRAALAGALGLGQWSALAATLAVGVLVGALGWRASHAGADAAPFGRQGDALVARGELADGAVAAVGGERPATTASGVRLGVSFRATDGHYCRSFTHGVDRRPGLPRRRRLAYSGAGRGRGRSRAPTARPAAPCRPRCSMRSTRRIAGRALDAAAERAARARGWQP